MTAPQGLDPKEHEAWLTLLTVMELVPAVVDAQLRRDHGLTRFEYYVLSMLSDCDCGTKPMTDLAVLTNGSLSRLSHAVRKLENRGWVAKQASQEDRRTTLVTLTDAGREQWLRATPSHLEEVRRILFDVIPAEAVTALGDILRPVADRAMAEGICPSSANTSEPAA